MTLTAKGRNKAEAEKQAAAVSRYGKDSPESLKPLMNWFSHIQKATQ
jgi:hypothetical protein